MDWSTIWWIYVVVAVFILFAGAWGHALDGKEMDRDRMLVILPAAASWPASLVVLAGYWCGEKHKARRALRKASDR